MKSTLKLAGLAFLALSAFTGCNPQEVDPEDDDSEETGESAQPLIQRIGASKVYSPDENIKITTPQGAQAGDLLVLFLSRTDDYIPMKLDNWTRAGECLKTDNGEPSCIRASECSEWIDNGAYCKTFGSKGKGHDLAQVVFYRYKGSGAVTTQSLKLKTKETEDTKNHPSWAIMVALRGMVGSNPIRALAGTSKDGDADSIFPSINAKAGDMLLTSQSFDDPASQGAFGAPADMSSMPNGYVVGADETGYVFSKLLSVTGATGKQETIGAGGPKDKDLMISVAIKGTP